jgi:hypothetical protein
MLPLLRRRFPKWLLSKTFKLSAKDFSEISRITNTGADFTKLSHFLVSVKRSDKLSMPTHAPECGEVAEH